LNKRETVQSLMDAVQMGNLELAASLLADDFQFSGPVPEPIDKEAWLRMSASLKAAIPDLDYHFKVIGTQGDVVRTTSQLSGTHSGSFDLTSMNMGVIPSSGKTFVATREKAKLTVKEDKITAWVVEPTQGAGVMAILKQLEPETPAM